MLMIPKPLRNDPNIGQILAELRRLAYISKRNGLFNLSNSISRNGFPADLVPVKMAADYTFSSIVTIRRRIRSGSIAAYYCGNRTLVSIAEVVTRSERPPRSPAQIEAAKRALADINARRAQRLESKESSPAHEPKQPGLR